MRTFKNLFKKKMRVKVVIETGNSTDDFERGLKKSIQTIEKLKEEHSIDCTLTFNGKYNL